MAAPALTGQGQQPGMATDSPNRSRQKSPESPELARDEPPKKRRRTVKPNADKKFECRHEGCGKSYSRAEHLYRHQLNHTPKNIYHCDFPDCNRYFVRQDLCVRHRERHTTAGSQLQKRDSFAQVSQNPTKQRASITPSGPVETDYGSNSSDTLPSNGSTVKLAQGQYAPTDRPRERRPSDPLKHDPTFGSTNMSPPNNVVDPRFLPPTPRAGSSRRASPYGRSSSFGDDILSSELPQKAGAYHQRRRRINYSSAIQPNNTTTSQSMPQSPSTTYSNSSVSTHPPPPFRSDSDTFVSNTHRDNSYLTGPSMLPITYSTNIHSPNGYRSSQDAFTAAVSQGLTSSNTDPYLYSNINNGHAPMDTSATYGYPLLGAEDYGRSPFVLNDEFAAWLFNPNVADQPNLSPDYLASTYMDHPVSQMQDPILSQVTNSSMPQHAQVSMNPMNMNNILDSSQPSNYVMSEHKRQELLDLMQTQFVERAHDAVKKRKDMVFEGDVDADGHVLSLRMMHTYIGSYWYHQHAQLPILHKPTFSADMTPTLLLLAVVAIGAATLDKAYGTSLTDSAAEFANFVVWHLRWEIIRDVDYRPPAKLWVFQTLLLIEVYEKMYSTRTLHERAHIHHDSTLTLMRRGSSLVGRLASESPGSLTEERSGQAATHGPTGGLGGSDDAWLRWITTEATRRAAFGAFVLDSIHSTMFGHAAKMVAHEMRLPLPCDEALWSAASPAEVGRVQASLRTNGVKPIMFLEGLKRTLNGQTVRTNSFGRTIIMAGLLSVSWHMTQRDLQIASIGPRAANSIGGPDKWRGTLLRAFDNWKRDFDEALAETAANAPLSPPRLNNGPKSQIGSLLRPVDDENIFESRTVLHHLAHIAAHVDIVDCQVFAGANRLLSRIVTPRDYSLIRDKIEKWAKRASARDSAFYALKFITTVLIPPGVNASSDSIDSRIYGHASPILPQAYDSDRYIARDDFLLNRPWVLYISALVVWCYGFALEGPIDPPPRDEDFATYEQREKDMRSYLDRVAGVRAPDDLERVTGKNRCLGLLLILKESFASTRWELTHEASGLLGNAAMKLKGIGEAEETIRQGTRLPPTKFQEVNGDGHANVVPMVEYGSTISAFNTARP
ncbi:hypothetical protein LTR70_006505 [Exophiala xenobiotica]|uniref:C2H2-type domain-containing protein n=1 Tax=Lithohypha guttulata TaxID=1690604 RepID=A0ABR0JY12_9EURO|nr:hypothetical protein LTR24_009214 [Lithohypha guttulata]KAK5315953.1 hypothetical protein LTR70_006505 [Exophiala xenobiotica]